MQTNRGYIKISKIVMSWEDWPKMFDLILDNFKGLKVLKTPPEPYASTLDSLGDNFTFFELEHPSFKQYEEYVITFVYTPIATQTVNPFVGGAYIGAPPLEYELKIGDITPVPKFIPIGLEPVDTNFEEWKKYLENLVCYLYGVPADMLNSTPLSKPNLWQRLIIQFNKLLNKIKDLL